MAGTYDTEDQRVIDRIRCIAFREARDAGATFIDRNWIAEKVHRRIRFITDWWQKPYDQCFADYSNAGRKLKLSRASQEIILEASGRQKKSCSMVAKEIAEKRKEYVVSRTINNYRHREGLKPFHVIPKPLKTETHIRSIMVV
jgi:transposase